MISRLAEGLTLLAPSSNGLLGGGLRAKLGKQGYIVGPAFDWFFFIGSPILALGLGLVLADTPIDRDSAWLNYERSILDFLIGSFIFAHLIIVIFRSHLNQKIFKLYPLRFTLIPLVVFLTMGFSTTALVFCSVLVTFWDVYHSGMQTFGLSRIYDGRAGNDWKAGRGLDIWLNIILYAGPIAAGATLMDHVEDFYEFEEIGAVFFTQIPAYAQSNASYLSWTVIVGGSLFLVYYLLRYWQLYRQGYQVSPQKVALLLSTAVCSIYAWGFNPFGMAFFIMNFFHALQYFAIVWWAEKGNMTRVLGVQNKSWGKLAAFGLLIGFGFGYGVWVELADVNDSAWLYAFFLLISLMHFWYDSFVWSVAKKQV